MSINTDHAVHGLHLNLEQTHKITSKLLSNRSKWKRMNSPRHCLSSKILIWSNKRHSVVLDDQWTAKKEWRIIPLNEFLNGPEFGLWPEVLKMYQHKCCMSSYIPDLFVLFLAWERTPQSFTFSRELIALSLFVVFWLLNFHSNGCHKGWVSSLTYKPFHDLSLTRCIKGLNLARIAFKVNQNVFYLVFYCMLMVLLWYIYQHIFQKKKKRVVFVIFNLSFLQKQLSTTPFPQMSLMTSG